MLSLDMNTSGVNTMTDIETGEWIEDGEAEFVGLDIVRSDRADITRSLSKTVLDTILRVDDREKAREKVYDEISSTVDDIHDGELSRRKIARPKGMSQSPREYGSVDKTPQPTYRGAKYANKHFDWEQLGEGSKPGLLYIDRVGGSWPAQYDADTAEDGDTVDAIAIEQPSKVPDEFTVDTDKQVEKVLQDPLDPILKAMRWSFEDAMLDTSQADITKFM